MKTVFVRSFAVKTDGEKLGFAGRMHLSGKDSLSLYPSLFLLNLWNLPEEMYLQLTRCKEIEVFFQDACLASGAISDVFKRATSEGIVTTVAISIGRNLWESVISMLIPEGEKLSEIVESILSESETGIELLSFPENDPESSRSRSLYGGAASCIEQLLTEIKARAMITRSGIMVVPPEGLPNEIRIDSEDLQDIPSFVGGIVQQSKKKMILFTSVAGWRPGQTVRLQYDKIDAKGIILSRQIDADTSSGPWITEMIVELI